MELTGRCNPNVVASKIFSSRLPVAPACAAFGRLRWVALMAGMLARLAHSQVTATEGAVVHTVAHSVSGIRVGPQGTRYARSHAGWHQACWQ
jgi:hypothetical protein